jgi:hypothetical protein
MRSRYTKKFSPELRTGRDGEGAGGAGAAKRGGSGGNTPKAFFCEEPSRILASCERLPAVWMHRAADTLEGKTAAKGRNWWLAALTDKRSAIATSMLCMTSTSMVGQAAR